MWKAWCEADALCSKLMFLTRDGCLRTVGARAKSGVFFFLADRGEWAGQRRTLEVEGWEEDNPGRACF